METAMAMTCGKCKTPKVTVDHVRACYAVASKAPVNPFAAEVPARDYDLEAALASALAPVAVLTAPACTDCPCDGDAEAHLANAEMAEFMAMVQDGLATPAPVQTALEAPELPAVKPAKVEIEDGMYVFDGDILKVQHAVHGSGKQYAKKLIKGHGPDWTFEYAPGMVSKLTPAHKLSMEKAKEFGALYGTCCVCARTLTDEKSISLGIGPKCAARLAKHLAA